jgi:MarR family
VAEWVVLREMYEADSIVPSALAERIGMTRGALSKLIDRLISKMGPSVSFDLPKRYARVSRLLVGLSAFLFPAVYPLWIKPITHFRLVSPRRGG